MFADLTVLRRVLLCVGVAVIIKTPSNWSVVQNKEHAWYYQPGGNEVVTFYAPVDKNSSSQVDRYVSVSVFKFQWASPETIKDYADNIAIPDIGADNKLLSSNENIRFTGVSCLSDMFILDTVKDHKVHEDCSK